MLQKLFARESKTIAGAALIIGASSIFSRILGLIRDRLLVSRFGVGDELDAYYASFQLPNLLFALLILGTLSVAFIPVFTEYLAKGKKEEAWRVTDTVLTAVVIGMGVLCGVLVLAAPLVVRLIAPGFEGEKLALTVRLTRIMMLTPFFFSISAVLSSVLNSYKRFFSVAVAPLLYNAGLIFGIVVLSRPFGIAGVAIGAVLGAILHVVIQIPEAAMVGLRIRPMFAFGHPGVREIGRLFLPRIFGIDISQLSLLIGSVIGTTLAAGSISLFNLAMNIVGVPLGIFAIPYAIAAFPVLSDAAARNDRREFVSVFASTFRQILFFLIPLSFLAIVLRVHIIRVVIGTRGLSWHETELAALSLACFAVSLPFQALTPLLARTFYAFKNTLIPVLISAAALAVNLVTAFLLLPHLQGQAQVVALPVAFSAASTIQVTLLFIILRRKFGRLGGSHILRAFLKFFAGSATAVVAAWAFVHWMGNVTDTSTFMSVFVQAAGATLIGMLAYGLVLWGLKSEELLSLIDTFRRKLFRLSPDMAVSDAHEM